MKLYKSISLLILFILIIIQNTQTTTYAHNYLNEQNTKEKVIVIIINRVEFIDLYKTKNIKKIIDNGSIALMNTRGAGRNNDYKSYATLGWGVRAEGAYASSLFYNADIETVSVYKRRIGIEPKDSAIINPNINVLINQNIKGEYRATPGELGHILKQNNYITAVLGNSDTDSQQLRMAGLIAMDKNGHIDYGNVNYQITEENSLYPFGKKTNYLFLLQEFKQIYEKANFIIIETGDTMRLEKYSGNLNLEMRTKHKNIILNEIDSFINEILKQINFDYSKLIIVSPYPSDQATKKGARLTPFIIYDEGQTKGVLSSATTRRKGIIGNVDMAPTILSYFNIQSQQMTGRAMYNIKLKDNYQYIQKLNKRTVSTSIYRYRVLYTFAIYEIIASILALLIIIFHKKIPTKYTIQYKNIAKLLLLSTIIAPFTLLILPIFHAYTITNIYIYLISITTILTLLIYKLLKNKPLEIIFLTSFIIAFGLFLDIVTGQNLIKSSLLGYDPIIGARYYGIGNEYMGVLIGASLIFIYTLLERYKLPRFLVSTIFIVTIIVIGHPKLGANVGGTITAAFTFIFAYIRLLGRKINYKVIIYIFLTVIIIVASMGIIDYFFIENKSHLANAIQQIIQNGPIAIYQIITRKIAMNIRVMGVTVWSRVLIISLIILGILFYKPIGILQKMIKKYPFLSIGWSGILIACIIAFMVNDSGVVSAATSVIFLSSSILYLAIETI